jgi:hypothetical protein
MSESADIKMSRIRRDNNAELKVLASILQPEVLKQHVPRLMDVQEARVAQRNIERQMAAFRDFEKGTQFQHVAQIDPSVWSAILEIFAKIDPVTNEPMHDGLLYKEDSRGNVVINRPFFYTLLAYLQAHGYECDMRTKKRLV